MASRVVRSIDLFDALADHRIAVGAHQDRRSAAEGGGQLVAALDGAHQPDAFIHRRSVGGEELAVVVHRLELDRQHAEDRAPFRMGMRDGDNLRTRFQNAGVNRPLVGRRFGAVEMVAVEILHDQPIARDVAGAHIGDCDKSFRAGHAHRDMCP
jgi:hypothetical protein